MLSYNKYVDNLKAISQCSGRISPLLNFLTWIKVYWFVCGVRHAYHRLIRLMMSTIKKDPKDELLSIQWSHSLAMKGFGGFITLSV